LWLTHLLATLTSRSRPGGIGCGASGAQQVLSRKECQCSYINGKRCADHQSASTQLTSTQLNSTQLNSTQLNSTQLNSPQLNSTQLNSTQLNSTQLNSNPLHPLSCMMRVPKRVVVLNRDKPDAHTIGFEQHQQAGE
jgi:hypothetical protein